MSESLSEQINTVHCIVQELQNAGVDMPMRDYDYVYSALESARESLADNDSPHKASEFLTYTIVVRRDDDVLADVLHHSAEGICFLYAEDNVSDTALSLGAEPTSWDTPLQDICQSLYGRGGAEAVCDYINEHRPTIPWQRCEPCDAQSPHVTTTDGAECLVCGNLIEQED